MASFVLLNDGTSFVVLNDGTSKVELNVTGFACEFLLNSGDQFLLNTGDLFLLNDDSCTAPVAGATGVVIEGTHAQAQIGTGKKRKSLWTQKKDKKKTVLFVPFKVEGKIVIKATIDVKSKIRFERVVGLLGKVSLLTETTVKSRIFLAKTEYKLFGRFSRKNTLEMFGKLPRYVLFKHEHEKSNKSQLKEIKDFLDMYKEINDDEL